MSRPPNSSHGSATVEQTGVVLLIALVMAALVGFYLIGPGEPPGRELGQRIANRIACGPRAPETCRRHPAVSAYGWPLARLVRYLAPLPMARPGAGGERLVPVDFRYCQRPSCAIPRPGERGSRLTTANRRITAFTTVEDRRASTGAVEITYWLYRPGLGWERLRKRAGPDDIEAASGTRVLLMDSPRLVPLEILPGRNHYRLPPGDEPPWRWRVESRFNG
ncbi:MAG: hypothetical protein JJE10_05190, partial [Thermoleophilia bacterium]|nr:hypothetical protein [Thermoleophilia bacterium]